MSAYWEPGTILGTGDVVVEKTDKIPATLELTL